MGRFNSRFNSRFNGRFEGRDSASNDRSDGLARIIDIPDLQAWYDASDEAYLTLVSTAITQMKDRSGKGNHTAVQGTGTARPTLTAAALNGKSVASFDGGDTLALPSGLYSIPNGANTVFIIAKRTTETGQSEYLLSMNEGGDTAAELRYLVDFSGTAGALQFLSSTAVNAVQVTGGTNTNYQIITSFRSGVTQSCALDGGTAGTDSNGASESGVDRGFIGSIANTSLFLTGSIAEILIYNRALSTAEILQVEIYLANKWGIYHPNATWINAYSAFWQMLIHAWKINKDNVGTDTTGNPFAAIYDPSVAALGSTTSLADVGRNINTATEATNPPVNTGGAIGTANGLLYNGTTTTLNAGSNASVDDIFAAGGCFIGVIKPTTEGEGGYGIIVDKVRTVVRLQSPSAGMCRMETLVDFNTTDGGWSSTSRIITLGAANIIAITYSSAATTNDPLFYVNSLTAKATSEDSTPVGTVVTDAASSLRLGNNESANSTTNGYLGKQLFMKSVPTTAQLTAVFNFLATEYGVTLT